MHCIMLTPRRFCPAVSYLIYSCPHDPCPSPERQFVPFLIMSARSKVALGNHAALEGLASLQLLPAVHRANLHTDEPLVCILRPEVGGSLGLRDPRVPHDGVFEVVTDDVEEGLAVLQHGCGVLLDGLVDAIGLAGDGDGGVVLRVLGGIENLVDVGSGTKAVDLDLGDVLSILVSEIVLQDPVELLLTSHLK